MDYPRVDLWRMLQWFMLMQEQRLVVRKFAAQQAGVGQNMISYWARRGYITKYYTFGNTYNYLVDLDEVLAQRELSYDRKRILYNKNWKLQSRSPDGTFLPLSK